MGGPERGGVGWLEEQDAGPERDPVIRDVGEGCARVICPRGRSYMGQFLSQ